MTIAVGLIGAGGIAREHLAAYARLDGVRVSHVADVDPGRARELAALAGGAAWAADPAAVFAAPGVDAVDICTSSETHAALAIAAAAHGKQVHVEKPAALSLTDFDAMVDAAGRHGVSLTVGQTARFQPVHRELARAIAGGTIGRLRLLRITWYAGHVWPEGWRAWQLDPARSGGHPLHLGIHAIDLATWLFDARPVRVFARGFRSWAPATGVPDSVHLTLRFDDGGMALVEISYALRARGDALRRVLAVGEAGSLHHTDEGEPGLVSDAARAPSLAVEGAMERQLAHWLATLRGEEAPIVTLPQARAALAAALAAQESLERRVAVEFAEVGERAEARSG